MLKAIALLLAIFVVFPIVLFLGLRRLARRWLRRQPRAGGAGSSVTTAGYALFTIQTPILFIGAAARQLEPSSLLGQFLNRPGGLLAGFLPVLLGVTILGTALSKLGCPPIYRK
jgi:hypothetical protein